MWIRSLFKISWSYWSLEFILFFKHILRIVFLVIWCMITVITLNIYLILIWVLLKVWSLNYFSLFYQWSILYFNKSLVLSVCPLTDIFILFNLSNILWVVTNGNKIIILCLDFLFLTFIKLHPFLNIFQILFDLSEIFWVVAHWDQLIIFYNTVQFLNS